jgi:hypothetical protein
MYIYIYCILVGGFKHDFYFPFHIWDVILPIGFHIFQDGLNHQPVYIYVHIHIYICKHMYVYLRLHMYLSVSFCRVSSIFRDLGVIGNNSADELGDGPTLSPPFILCGS